MRIDLPLEDFLALPDTEKVAYIGDRGILYAQQFRRADLDRYNEVADAARKLARRPQGSAFMSGLLKHRMALNFFVQPSSRTFMSFNAAEALLGLNRMSVRDPAISSMSKGETLVDSVRTFISYVDLIVMRHADDDAAATAFWTASRAHRRITLPGGEKVPVPIVSGGSGTTQHPTQALLDVYTLERSLRPVGGIDGKTLLLVGDLARGRTTRSLAFLMPEYRDVKLVFAAPEKFRMGQDVRDFLDARGVPWSEVESLDAGIERADAIYMTRIQDEHDAGKQKGVHEKAEDRFRFTLDHLDAMKPHAALLHPLPKRDEIDPAVDDVEDRRVAYWRQERNGMWMRVAILAHLFRVDGLLLDAASAPVGG
ncbi:MAG: aspartate carbamoyltransferase [Alphaproteobacteria bacterium]|nr:aspartate carbamoyltransferase [Alphaproteobacteria bacterium]